MEDSTNVGKNDRKPPGEIKIICISLAFTILIVGLYVFVKIQIDGSFLPKRTGVDVIDPRAIEGLEDQISEIIKP